MKYSIAIPVHDNYETILNCVNSALNQDFIDFEIIISDTSKDDKTHEIIKKVICNCNKIRYFRNDKEWSMWDNHNFLINNASGKYILFLHADDFLLPNAIKTIDNFLNLKNNPTRIIISGSSVYGDYKNLIVKLGLDYNDWILGEEALNLFALGGLTPSGTVFSNDIKEFGGFIYDGMLVPYSDCWTELKLCLNGYRYFHINDIYFIRNSNGTNFKYGNKKEIKKVYTLLKKEFSKEQLILIKNSALKNMSYELIKFFLQDSDFRISIKLILFKELIKHPIKMLGVVKILLMF